MFFIARYKKASLSRKDGRATSSGPRTSSDPGLHKKKKKDKSDTNHNELCYSPGRCHSHWERASKLIEILEQDAATDNQVEVLDHNSRTLERLLWWERRGY